MLEEDRRPGPHHPVFLGVLKLSFRNQNLHMIILLCLHLYTVRMYPSSVNTLCVSGLYPAIEIMVGWVELEVTFCSDSTQVTSTAYIIYKYSLWSDGSPNEV